MNPGIEHREAFTVLGTQSRIQQGTETPELFSEIWKEFERELEMIESLALSKEYYGVNFPAGSEELSDYLAGMIVSDDSPQPGNLVKRQVPEGEYAVFECPVEGIGSCYQYIFTKWLTAASLKYNPENPVFEEYPEKDSVHPVRIHISVKKND